MLNFCTNPKRKYFEAHPQAIENVLLNRLLLLEKLEKSTLSLAEQTEIAKIKSEISQKPLQYSNEYRIERLLLKLHKHVPRSLRQILKRTYINVQVDRKINAGAVKTVKSGKYFFIEYYGGLYQFVEILGDTLARAIILSLYSGQPDPYGEIPILDSDLNLGAQKLLFVRKHHAVPQAGSQPIHTKTWAIKESKVFPYIGLNMHRLKSAMNYFIINHEIGHHYLGHTKKGAQSITDDFDKYSKSFVSASPRQRMEYSADLFATLIFMKKSKSVSKHLKLSQLDMAFGPLLVLIALSLAFPHMTLKPSLNYPSHQQRFNNVYIPISDKLSAPDLAVLKLAINILIDRLVQVGFPSVQALRIK